jgi:hypothetical protein
MLNYQRVSSIVYIICWTNDLCHMIGIVNITWPILDTLQTIKLLVACLVDNRIVTKRLVRISFYPCKIDRVIRHLFQIFQVQLYSCSIGIQSHRPAALVPTPAPLEEPSHLISPVTWEIMGFHRISSLRTCWFIQGGAPKIAKLVNITLISRLDLW